MVRQKRQYIHTHRERETGVKHSLCAYLLQVDAMVDVMRSDIHLDIREVAVQRPDSAVVGPR